jgi:hypothetical protein
MPPARLVPGCSLIACGLDSATSLAESSQLAEISR